MVRDRIESDDVAESAPHVDSPNLNPHSLSASGSDKYVMDEVEIAEHR